MMAVVMMVTIVVPTMIAVALHATERAIVFVMPMAPRHRHWSAWAGRAVSEDNGAAAAVRSKILHEGFVQLVSFFRAHDPHDDLAHLVHPLGSKPWWERRMTMIGMAFALSLARTFAWPAVARSTIAGPLVAGPLVAGPAIARPAFIGTAVARRTIAAAALGRRWRRLAVAVVI